MKPMTRAFVLLAVVAFAQSLRADESDSYSQAMTMLSEARLIRSSTDARNRKLLQAEVALNKFLQASPDHEKFGQASIQLGTIHLDRARGLNWESRTTLNGGKRAKLQEQARENIVKAKAAFRPAHDKFQALFTAFPRFIPPDAKGELAKRSVAEKGYLQSQLYLAQARYEEAQTYDIGSAVRAEILIDAAKQFELIHEKYRSRVVGLYARMWQGKCFQEQNELKRAMGIYNELLGHGNSETPSKTLQNLQDRVLRFRLICLNDETRRDYQLIVVEGESWLTRRKAKVSTPTGLGIRWELAQAYESLGEQPELEAAKVSKFLKKALEHASEVAKFPGEYTETSNRMVQRLKPRLTGSKD